MADLVRDHICPGEVAGRAELAAHVLIEGEVEVDALVGRAVEGPDRRGRPAAALGAHGAVIDDELGAVVGLAVLLEGAGPGLLGVVEDVVGELVQLALGILVGRDRLLVFRAWRLDPGAEDVVDAEPRLSRPAAEDLDRDDDQHYDEARSAAEAGDAARDREPAAEAARTTRLGERPGRRSRRGPGPCFASTSSAQESRLVVDGGVRRRYARSGSGVGSARG